MTVPSVMAKGCPLDLSLNGTRFSSVDYCAATSYQKNPTSYQSAILKQAELLAQYEYHVPAAPRSRSGSQDSHPGFGHLRHERARLRALGHMPQVAFDSSIYHLDQNEKLQTAALAQAYQSEIIRNAFNIAQLRNKLHSYEESEETCHSDISRTDRSQPVAASESEDGSNKERSLSSVSSPCGSASEYEHKSADLLQEERVATTGQKKKTKKRRSLKHKRRRSHAGRHSRSAKQSVPSAKCGQIQETSRESDMKPKITYVHNFQTCGKPVKVKLRPVQSSSKSMKHKNSNDDSLLSNLHQISQGISYKMGQKLPKMTPISASYDLAYPHGVSVINPLTGASLTQTDLTATKSSNHPAQRFSNQTTRLASEFNRVIKVYLSDRQSENTTELGLAVPCPPPVTPVPDYMKRYEYIPSMYDIRSQRAVKVKLEVLEKQAKKHIQQLQEDKMKKEKLHRRERERELKLQQRRQIYALNKVMTQLENNNFRAFCQTNGIECKL